jgi:KR domain.
MAGGPEEQLAWRHGQPHAPRLARAAGWRGVSKPTAYNLSDGHIVALSGGLGGLGIPVPGWLLKHTACTVALLSRSSRTTTRDADVSHLDLLAGNPRRVCVRRANVAEAPDLQAAVCALHHGL